VPAVAAADLMLPPPAEGSREVAERVAAARDIQVTRYADLVFQESCPTPPRPPMSSRWLRNRMPAASP
jgi:predicted ATPase with chaperone activity